MVERVEMTSEPTPPVDPNATPAPTSTTEKTPPASQDAPTDRPAWLPEKFKTPEEFAKSYAEMERQRGIDLAEKQKAEADKNKSPEQKQANDKAEADKAAADKTAAEKAAAEKGIDLAQLSAEYASNGKKLSDDSYKALEAKGFDKATVDRVIAGQEALQATERASMFSDAGVKDDAEYALITQWAAKNMKPDDVRAYNETVQGADTAKTRQALTGLVAQYRAAVGKDPALITGDGTSPSNDAYGSREEMIRDMQNPLYKSDPAFRRKVEAKVERSSIF